MASNIKVVGKPNQKQEELSLTDRQKRLKSKVDKIGKEFFPAWVFVVALSLLWGTILIGSMVILVNNPISGALCALTLVLVTTLSVLAYETYSAKWRTVAWAAVLSLTLTGILTQLDDFPGKLLVIVIPTLILVGLRANMNGRKFLESRRLR